MRMDVNKQAIANLGNNVKTIVKNENCSVLMLNDTTGEGVMTVYQVMPGVMICFSDIHMEKCDSEFELQKDRRVFCLDHCREGRIEMEVQPGVFSIMQENELRLDNRENHKGTTCYPLRHYHGVSVFMDVDEAQQALDEMFHGFSVDIAGLRERYCNREKPCILHKDEGLACIISGLYQKNLERPEMAASKEYYQIKVVELLLYLETMTLEDSSVNVVEISERGAVMASSTCHNQLCVQMGEVTLDNWETRPNQQFIICLPNREVWNWW